jgi:hypothetical protein
MGSVVRFTRKRRKAVVSGDESTRSAGERPKLERARAAVTYVSATG